MAIEEVKKEKILYYLGAGASAQALPLARSIWKNKPDMIGAGAIPDDFPIAPEINGLAYELEKFTGFVNSSAHKEDIYLEKIQAAGKTLAKLANDFGDVDTYAKYLQITGQHDKLNDLKKTLSQYFAIKQTIHEARDKRYLPWLVGIMNNSEFPENVKILSWNYDSQVQLAAMNFGDNEDIQYDVTGYSYQPSMISCYPNLEASASHSNLSLIHLNGRAGFSSLDKSGRESVFQKKNCNSKEAVLNFVSEKEMCSALNFAWEKSGYHSRLMKHVKHMIDEVTIVVVIGYSFPFFNREVDKQIFEQLIANNTLHKIYF
jgi:hypothetical protein